MQKVRYKTEGYITTITTDGYTAYDKVIKQTWGYNNKIGKHNIYHNKHIASKGEGFISSNSQKNVDDFLIKKYNINI